jgi:hypothetical protein
MTKDLFRKESNQEVMRLFDTLPPPIFQNSVQSTRLRSCSTVPGTVYVTVSANRIIQDV